jgi:hypothetical protein
MTARTLRCTAQRIQQLAAEAAGLRAELERLVAAVAPWLLELSGVGPISAAQVLVSWSHAGRLRSEAAFAALAGANPIPASVEREEHQGAPVPEASGGPATVQAVGTLRSRPDAASHRRVTNQEELRDGRSRAARPGHRRPLRQRVRAAAARTLEPGARADLGAARPPPATPTRGRAGHRRAAGVYALPLAAQGYQVHLIDPLALHVQQALRASAEQPAAPLATPGWVLAAAAISRFASTLDGLLRGYLDEPGFEAIVERDLRDGQHRNPTGRPEWFTTAYFHLPEELAQEVGEAGLRLHALLAVEGPAWMLPDIQQRLADPTRRERVLAAIRRVETEPSLLGASSHLLAVAHR